MAEKTGLEPATSCVTGRHSNQLSYFSVILVEVVGVEPTMFLMWRIYSPLPSTNSAHSSKIVHTLRYAFRHRSKVNGECVLKHTRLVALSPRHSSFGICFNTL